VNVEKLLKELNESILLTYQSTVVPLEKRYADEKNEDIQDEKWKLTSSQLKSVCEKLSEAIYVGMSGLITKLEQSMTHLNAQINQSRLDIMQS